MRYDVAIIGGGAEGLIAAALLGRARLRTIVLERNEQTGGRCVTREFHPGFRASPFADEIVPIPAELHWALDLSRRGAIFAPAPVSTALWPDRQSVLRPRCNPAARRTASVAAADEIGRRALADAAVQPRNWWPQLSGRQAQPWPARDFAETSLADVMAGCVSDRPTAAHLIAQTTAGRTVDPSAPGTALHLLAPGFGGSGFVTGGLARLGEALASAARDAGAEIRCGLEVGELRHRRGRALGVSLADGTQIEAAAVISTLDFCRTFLSLFRWRDLPKDVAARSQSFRFAGSTARILFALSQAPRLDAEVLRGPIFAAPDLEKMQQANESFRSATIPEAPPIMLRIVSASDPSLAPAGAAAVTATVGAVPHRLFDGTWSHSRREQLLKIVQDTIETVLPGFGKAVLGTEVIVPPDIEQAIAVCEGDLSGGEIAPDQMLGGRPGLAVAAPRTFLRGLYVAGKSTPAGPLATGASAAVAAHAVLADFAAGRIKRVERAE